MRAVLLPWSAFLRLCPNLYGVLHGVLGAVASRGFVGPHQDHYCNLLVLDGSKFKYVFFWVAHWGLFENVSKRWGFFVC